jgi:hypothetical protein
MSYEITSILLPKKRIGFEFLTGILARVDGVETGQET